MPPEDYGVCVSTPKYSLSCRNTIGSTGPRPIGSTGPRPFVFLHICPSLEGRRLCSSRRYNLLLDKKLSVKSQRLILGLEGQANGTSHTMCGEPPVGEKSGATPLTKKGQEAIDKLQILWAPTKKRAA